MTGMDAYVFWQKHSRMNRWLVVFFAALLACSQAVAQSPRGRSEEIVRIADTDYYLHTVSPGETVYSLSKIYGITQERLYEDNPQVKTDGLRAGETVRIVCTGIPQANMSRRRMQRLFTPHTVQPGETAYSIAKRYSVSLSALIKDNPGLDPSHLKAGEELLIRKSEMDKTSPQQILSQLDDFAATLSEVSDEYAYHPVEMGETLYSISRKYNVSIADIEAENNLLDGLKAGALLKIPVSGRERPAEERDGGVLVDGLGGSDISQADEHRWHPLKRSSAEDLSVSLLLPLSEGGEVRSNFMEFYQGTLLAAEELRAAGYDVELNVFNTGHSADTVEKIVSTEAFRRSDLIIGPVYEDELPAVAEFSIRTGVPVVSPLADLEGSYGPTLYKLSPDPTYRYDKMRELIGEGKNIIFITSDFTDEEFEKDMKAVVGNKPYQVVHYRKGTPSHQIDKLIGGRDTENIFIVVAGDEAGVDLILAALSSVQNSRLGRSVSTGTIKVIGNSKWMRFRNLDRGLLFKLNVSFVTSYHADRGNAAVVDFDNRYIGSYGRIPTLYSYRGYDALKMFGRSYLAPVSDADGAPEGVVVPLQTPYEFVRGADGGNSNTQWVIVSYSDDYTIKAH